MRPSPSSSSDSPVVPLVVLVPWAVSLSEPCQHALPQLDAPAQLPHLRRLLAALTQQAWLRGDEYQRATPHERFLAQRWGWPDSSADAQMPWAARQARLEGLPVVEGEGWGLLSPGHWLMGRDHLTLLPPDELQLEAAESRVFFDAVQPLFEGEGWRLLWGAPTRWYAVHDSLAEVPTASLDRVVGRNPDLWMPNHPQARLIRRLQAEVQMVFYQHPLNDERERQGLLTINSFWLSGTGRALPRALQAAEPPVQVQGGPRQALLRDDFAAWLQAWSELDHTALREACEALDQGRPVELVLCGERHALSMTLPERAPGGLQALWQGLKQGWRAQPVAPSSILAQL